MVLNSILKFDSFFKRDNKSFSVEKWHVHYQISERLFSNKKPSANKELKEWWQSQEIRNVSNISVTFIHYWWSAISIKICDPVFQLGMPYKNRCWSRWLSGIQNYLIETFVRVPMRDHLMPHIHFFFKLKVTKSRKKDDDKFRKRNISQG